jgi:hypothetical protein
MGVHHQYHPNKYPNSSSTRLLHLTIPSTSSFLYDKNDYIWNNPTELDLLNVKKAPIMNNTSIDENYFLKVLPCIRRLYIVFNSICPNIYRIHCSDSLRILQELICLIEEYLHIQPPSTISINELLYNETVFDNFIHQLKLLPTYQLYPDIYSSSTKTEIRCFGQGIHGCDYKNELYQTLVFCFELTTSKDNHLSLPVSVLILDSNENIVPNDIKYINKYDQGYTKLYSCSYKPRTQTGTYKISVFHNHIPITTTPFNVFIRNHNNEHDQLLLKDMKNMIDQGKNNNFLSRFLFYLINAIDCNLLFQVFVALKDGNIQNVLFLLLFFRVMIIHSMNENRALDLTITKFSN